MSVTFNLSPYHLLVAPELVFAEALEPEITALGGSALSITVNGPSLREAPDTAREWLDEPIFGVRDSIKRGLHVLGIYTVRQALVVGAEAMLPHLPANPAVMDNIQTQIGHRCPGLWLLRRPVPAYTATFCRNLDEVPIAAIFPQNLGREAPSVHDVMVRDEAALRPVPAEFLSDIRARAFEFAPKFREARRRIEQT